MSGTPGFEAPNKCAPANRRCASPPARIKSGLNAGRQFEGAVHAPPLNVGGGRSPLTFQSRRV